MSAPEIATEYPAACLRGIRIGKWIIDDGVGGKVLTADAFQFEEAAREGLPHTGWLEVSINWEDDANAIDFTRGQKSAKGLPINQHGVGRISLVDLTLCRTLMRMTETFTFERRRDAAQPDNPYHGNFLVAPDVPTAFHRQLAGALGLLTRPVPAGA
jgi:hypothetical protein